jgi:hypothetical protein
MLRARNVHALTVNHSGLEVLLSVATLVVVFASTPVHAQTFQNMHDFNCKTQGCNPVDNGYLAVGEDNNLYGTTAGNHSVGTIFMITPTPPFTYTDPINSALKPLPPRFQA